MVPASESYNYQVIQKIPPQEGRVILKVINNKVSVVDELLKNVFAQSGIAIPPHQQAKYDGKARVYLDDPKFAKAFHDIYFLYSINSNEYDLVDL